MPTAAQNRSFLIGMARRRQRAGSGSSREFLLRRTAQLKFPDVSSILAGIPWAATGAAAVRLYMPERMTNDLDILIRHIDSSAVRDRLRESNAEHFGDLAIGGSSWRLADGFPLDVIENGEPWVDQALREAEDNRDAQGMPVLTLPYQVLLKFRASRLQDLADISRMLGQATDAQLDSTRQLFSELMPKDMDDLESLVELGRLELE